MPPKEKTSAAQEYLDAATPVMKSIAPVAVSGAIEHLMGVSADRRAQKYYRENQESMYRYGQMAQVNAARNEVEGLKKAGLSTALAGGAQGMSTSVAAMPHQNPKSVAANPEAAMVNSNLSLNAKQGALLDSETDLNKAREQGVLIDNANKEGENLTYASAYDEILDVIEQDAIVAKDGVTLNLVAALRQNKNIFRTAGDIKALKDVAAMAQASPAIMAQRIHNALNTAIDTAAANNPNWVAAQIARPLLENAEIRERMALLAANTAKFMSDTEANKALLPKIKAETEHLGALISNLNIDTEKIHNSDIVGAIKNGDWSTVGAHAAVGLADAAGDAVKAYAAAKGGAKGFIEGKGALEQRAQQNAAPSKSGAPRKRIDWEHPLKPKPSKPVDIRDRMTVINGKPFYRDDKGNWHKIK